MPPLLSAIWLVLVTEVRFANADLLGSCPVPRYADAQIRGSLRTQGSCTREKYSIRLGPH